MNILSQVLLVSWSNLQIIISIKLSVSGCDNLVGGDLENVDKELILQKLIVKIFLR